MARYGLCIDLSRCIGCYSCVVGCKNWNGMEAGEKGRIDIMDLFEGDYPRVDRWILPVLCMQCDHPPCVAVCRYGASVQTEQGVVFVDPEKCTGCELCTFACPYGARVMREGGRVADSCDLCLERVQEGRQPYCVESCPMDTLVFGDLDDEGSDIRRLMKEGEAEPLHKHFGTRPKVYYTHIKGLTGSGA